MSARLFGLGCLVAAIVAAWWGIWEPMQAAEAQVGRVRYRMEVFVLVPAAGVFGLFFLIFGGKVPYRDAERQNFTGAGWAIIALMALASGAGFWWFKDRMTSLGYAYSGAGPQPAASFSPPPIPSPPQVQGMAERR
jgi:hypothetical protein